MLLMFYHFGFRQIVFNQINCKLTEAVIRAEPPSMWLGIVHGAASNKAGFDPIC